MRMVPFMKYRQVAAWSSVALLLMAVASLSIQSLNWGLDFTGGTLVEVSYPAPTNPEQIRLNLDNAGWNGHVVQYFGSDRDILVRMPPQKLLSDKDNARLGDRLFAALSTAADGQINLRRSEFVGPAVGEELANQGGLGLLAALAMVTMAALAVMAVGPVEFAIGQIPCRYEVSGIIQAPSCGVTGPFNAVGGVRGAEYSSESGISRRRRPYWSHSGSEYLTQRPSLHSAFFSCSQLRRKSISL